MKHKKIIVLLVMFVSLFMTACTKPVDEKKKNNCEEQSTEYMNCDWNTQKNRCVCSEK